MTVLPEVELRAGGRLGDRCSGRAGRGKSTLIRAVAGVQQIAGSRVNVLGLPAGSTQPRAGRLHDAAASVYGDLGVRENLAFFARVLGQPREAVERALVNAGNPQMVRCSARRTTREEA